MKLLPHELPRDLSGSTLVKALAKLGYVVTRQTGSHIRLTTQENGEHHLTIPAHDPILIGTQIRRKRPDLVIRVVDETGTPRKSTLDPEILLWYEEYRFVLVTNNRKSMPVHLTEHIIQGRHVPGIFILKTVRFY